jgi:hypothetical protein
VCVCVCVCGCCWGLCVFCVVCRLQAPCRLAAPLNSTNQPNSPPTHPHARTHAHTCTDAEDFYKLNDLALLAQVALADPSQEPLKHPQYLRKFGELKLTGAALVAALDYADVVKYLRGEVATADQVCVRERAKRRGRGRVFLGLDRRVDEWMNGWLRTGLALFPFGYVDTTTMHRSTAVGSSPASVSGRRGRRRLGGRRTCLSGWTSGWGKYLSKALVVLSVMLLF